MTDSPVPPKKPFGPEHYADVRGPDDRSRKRERGEVAKQVRTLNTRSASNIQRRRLVGKIQKRRAGTHDAVQVELVARTGRIDLIAASGRLLIRDGDLSEAARTELGKAGILEVSRSGAVALLEVPPGAAPDGIAALAARLRREGVPVALDHVPPLGGWVKGDGGPEPTTLTRPFPAVEFPQPGEQPFVAVLDSGISNEGRTDGYLKAPEVSPTEVDLLDVFPVAGLLDGDAGHGSMVVGVVQQVVPPARVGSYRVADSDGMTTSFQVADKMRQAVSDGAMILNLSLGTGTEDGNPPIALADVVDELLHDRPEVLIVCAAGNEGSISPIWPAAFAATHPNVVAVAALDAAGAPAGWSSHGAWVTCSAVGEGVASTYVVGTEDGEQIEDPTPDTFFAPNPWAVWSGTSFAAPQIAGAVARICIENAGVSPQQALKMLEADATPAPQGSTHGWRVEILPGT